MPNIILPTYSTATTSTNAVLSPYVTVSLVPQVESPKVPKPDPNVQQPLEF